MVLLLLPSLLAAPRISELLYDPSGADHDQEWVEICNAGPNAINLSGYVLQMGGTSWKSIFTIGTVADMAPGDYVLVGGPLAAVGYAGSFTDDIQNGGSDVDGVRLIDGSAVVLDTVLFGGSSNGNSLLDDSGSSDPARAATSASNGKSLGRDSACTDTDNSAVDFRVYTSPTPAMANVAIGDSGGDSGVVVTADCTGSADVVINEFLPDASGADDGQEWVELYNRGSVTVDVSGWVLALAGSTWDNGDEMTLASGLGLPPGGFLLLGTAGGDAPLDLTLPNASSSGEGLQLRCNGSTVDTVVYGPSNGDSLSDDTGSVASSLAPKPKEAQSIVRKVDG
ncbi:MAG TPA: lamin tail domain-containing protein, partial [Myxococcota bacterium]|nr:lamin tail domain-containing protein [Myxococcota bacterium]